MDLTQISLPRVEALSSRDQGMEHEVDEAISTTESVLYDAVRIPGGSKSIDQLLKKSKFLKFINEAFKHCKAIAAENEGEKFIDHTFIENRKDDSAILMNEKPELFSKAIAKHRNWDRVKITNEIPV